MHAAKTQLEQQRCNFPMDASRIYNDEHGDRIPLVLVPQARTCCSCFYHIPSGINTIVHDCGDDAYPDGMAPPGLQMCKPYWNHVAYMVTQQACTYNAPVKSCPTKDNVMVDCELTLVFSIGPDPICVKNFVYNLGALKFNEFLAAECEESIRQLIRVTPLGEVYELRGSSSMHVQNVLNVLDEKFKEFGVTFSKAAITDVVLNNELRRILQGTTEFKTKIKELDKEHEHKIKIITYEHEQKRAESGRNYERRLQDIGADINVALVTRERDSVNAQSRKEVAITKSQEKACVYEKRADSQLSVATLQAQMENADLLAKVQSKAKASVIEATKQAEVSIFESRELIKVAKSRAQALKILAQAEGEATESLLVIREHNLEMAKLEVTEAIARKAKMVISGDHGEALIGSILDRDFLNALKI